MNYPFDVNRALLWLGDLVDLIFVFFDPIGQVNRKWAYKPTYLWTLIFLAVIGYVGGCLWLLLVSLPIPFELIYSSRMFVIPFLCCKIESLKNLHFEKEYSFIFAMVTRVTATLDHFLVLSFYSYSFIGIISSDFFYVSSDIS